MFGTKCPSMTSMWSQSALCPIVSTQAAPRAAKSADRIDGAIIALGDIMYVFVLYMYLSDEDFECVTIRYSLLRDLLETF